MVGGVVAFDPADERWIWGWLVMLVKGPRKRAAHLLVDQLAGLDQTMVVAFVKAAQALPKFGCCPHLLTGFLLIQPIAANFNP
jgi:hypothetical protein